MSFSLDIYKFLALDIWHYEVIGGNTLGGLLIALGVFLGFLIVFKILQVMIIANLKRVAKKTATDIDDMLVTVIASLRPPFYIFVAVYVALFSISIDATLHRVITGVLVVWVIYQAITAARILFDYIIRKSLRNRDDTASEGAIVMLGNIAKWVLWTIGVLLMLSNLGVDVTSLIAGLGIGGIAVAFALQGILGDLFSSFAIYFDKPFVPGDFIVVGDKSGVVQTIGIKTTRVKALQGEEMVFSNKELTSAEISNFKKMQERRTSFTVGITYETPREQVAHVAGYIKDIIEHTPNTRFDRAHFSTFADSALVFDIVYYVTSPDYAVYMDAQQSINLAILKKFEEEDIAMAYPTSTVHVLTDRS